MEGKNALCLFQLNYKDTEVGHLFEPTEFCIFNSAFVCKLEFLMCHPSFGGCPKNMK